MPYFVCSLTGTLAIITEACLKVHPIPKHALALRVSFPSAQEAALAATGALKDGISLCRAEMMDEQMVRVSYASCDVCRIGQVTPVRAMSV